ncbi:MAG: ABC transporter permease [Syntrophus sp. SKADARSKE-3]|nr:ABC transporter permease [Syntrophus sp. SKADARSKE-3]
MFWNAILLSMREIRRNALRSFLTILGVVLGIAAVVTMVNVGEGATARINLDIESLGSNALGIYNTYDSASTRPVFFTVSDIDAIAGISSVTAAAPLERSIGQNMIVRNENWETMLIGSNNEYLDVNNRTIASGRQFTETEIQAGSCSCILGETVYRKLFGSQKALGEKIRLNMTSLEVVGILREKGESSFGRDQDDMVLIPLRTYQRRISGNQRIGFIQVATRKGAPIEKAKQDISSLIRERRHLRVTEEDNFKVFDLSEYKKKLASNSRMLTTLLSIVAIIGLFVGGVGIMNIMLVSVTERTREIGIRLAIGALDREVLIQFLVEAVTMSSLGGFIGLALAFGATFWIAKLMQVPFIFNIGIGLLSLLFSAAIGIIFGIFPALKASHLDPIEALRYE